jgi:hypothetical protein
MEKKENRERHQGKVDLVSQSHPLFEQVTAKIEKSHPE